MSEYYFKTPCVGRCSTVYGDTVCRGCRRSFAEVTQWNQLAAQARQAIGLRLDQQLETSLKPKVVVPDGLVLRQRIKAAQLDLDLQVSLWRLVYGVLREAMEARVSLAECGVTLNAPWSHWPLTELMAHIEDELYSLALQQSA